MRLGLPLSVGRRVMLAVQAMVALGLAVPALGQVSVSPTSVLFDGEAGTKAITVKNVGKREQVFRISLVDLRMLPDGRMVVAGAPEADEHFASGMVRFSPREVVLEPGESDVVRLRAAPPGPGEYRTHVLVQQVPDVHALQTSPFERREGVELDLQAVFGVAVPLIIRQGELPVSVAFSEARLMTLADGTPAVSLRLERLGARSVRGAVSLLRDGKEIALFDGIAIYAPAPRRDLLLPLAPADAASLHEGSLKVVFQEPEDAPGAVAATAVVQSR